MIYREETFQIIGAAMAVHKELGCGFLEPVYQDAFEIELRNQQIPFEREMELKIRYKGEYLSKVYRPDFVCFGKIIVELKALSEYSGIEKAQLINYLKAADLEIGLLMNFGKKSLEHERLVRFKDQSSDY